MIGQLTKHDTASELSFLDGIGRWSETHKFSRLELLKRYLKSMNRRSKWDGIDKHQVERHVLGLIEREQVLQ